MSKQDSGMDLNEFVRKVFLETIRGVNEAANTVRMEHTSSDLRGAINPMSEGKTTDIEFDVSISVSTSSGGDLGVRVPMFEVGIGGKAERARQRTSRVNFSVPVAFASQPVGEKFISTAAPSPSPSHDDSVHGSPGPPGSTDGR